MKKTNEVPKRQLSHHILPSSANLLGVSFIIFNLVKTVGNHKKTLLDEFVLVAIFTFLFSCGFSYMSLRAKEDDYYEKIADLLFILGILILTASSVVVAFEL